MNSTITFAEVRNWLATVPDDQVFYLSACHDCLVAQFLRDRYQAPMGAVQVGWNGAKVHIHAGDPTFYNLESKLASFVKTSAIHLKCHGKAKTGVTAKVLKELMITPEEAEVMERERFALEDATGDTRAPWQILMDAVEEVRVQPKMAAAMVSILLMVGIIT